MNIIEFLHKNKFEYNVVFAKLAGSRGYNLHNENSDYDWSGVFAVPTKQFLGFDNNCEHIERSNQADKYESPDISFYEIAKFSRLLLVGNPNILEMLWTKSNCFESPAWHHLRNNREKFLSKRAIHNYMGYAEGQIKRAIVRKFDPQVRKWMMHTFRLVMDAESILKCHHIELAKNGEDREFLLQVKGGHFNFDELITQASSRINNIHVCLENSNLPDEGDRKWLNQWVINYRLEDLKT